MAYQRIVAAVDESPAGVHALRVGAQIAAAAEAELIALRVVDDPWRFIEPGEVEAKRAQRDNSWAAVAATRVSDEMGRLIASAGIPMSRARPDVRFGIPAVEIARWAELDQADLIVLGRQPVGPLERRPAGRTIEGTLRRARVPCLVVPFGHRTWHRILVLAHDDQAAGDVLDQAFAFSAVFASEVVVVDTEPQLVGAGSGRGEPVARRAFATWARLPRAGTIDVMTCEGEGAAELLKAARARQADLVVIGLRRGESVDDTSEAARVLQRAPCAVLTVPV
jgi:nucleotide-binding universal stress UspA family protein